LIKAAIHGRIGNDPVQRETRAGASMCTASVAVNVAKPNEDAVTEWISIAAFGSIGEALSRHVKGDVITALGVLTRSSFTGRDGQQHAAWGLVAESMLSVRTVRSSGARRQTRTPPLRRAPRRPAMPPPGPLADDRVDDLWPAGEP
jgi:single-strand DNA-binding protein